MSPGGDSCAGWVGHVPGLGNNNDDGEEESVKPST